MNSTPRSANTATGKEAISASCRSCGAWHLCHSLWLKTGDTTLLKRVVRRKQVFRRGEVIYRAGQSAQHLYVIRGGSVRTGISSKDGQMQVTGFHRAGELLGLGAMENREYHSEARATGLTSVCEVSVEHFEELARTDPDIQYSLIRIMRAEIHRNYRLMLLLGKSSAREKLAAFLLELSETSARHRCSSTEFNLSMSRSDIGDYLGIAKETVCRILTRFEEEGLISSQCRYIKLENPEKLRQAARPV